MISDGCRHMPLHAADHLYLPSATSTHQATDGPVESAWDSSSVLEVAIRIGSIMQPRFVPPARARFLRPQPPMTGLNAMSASFTNAIGVRPESMR